MRKLLFMALILSIVLSGCATTSSTSSTPIQNTSQSTPSHPVITPGVGLMIGI